MEYWTWDTDEFNNSGMVPLIIEDLAAIGVRVSVTSHSPDEARNHLKQRGHGSIFLGNWYAAFPDPDNFFFIFYHSESKAIAGMFYGNEEVDALIEEARRTSDIERRAEIYRGLSERSVEESALVPLFHERFFVVHAPNIRGLRTHLGPPPLRYREIWIER